MKAEHLGVFTCGERMLVEAKARRLVWLSLIAQATGELRTIDQTIEAYEGKDWQNGGSRD